MIVPTHTAHTIKAAGTRLRSVDLVCVILAIVGLTSCTGSTTKPGTNPPPPTIAISINPGSASIQEGNTKQFSATVTGSANGNVTWSATGGTITTAGLYTAGNAPGPFTVTATSMADNSKSASAALAITAPAPPPPPSPPPRYKRTELPGRSAPPSPSDNSSMATTMSLAQSQLLQSTQLPQLPRLT